MSAPVRLHLSRRRGFDLQAHSRESNGLPAVNCARPGKWGNPYRVGDPFHYWAEPKPVRNPANVEDLRPKVRHGRVMRRREGMTAEEAVDLFRRGVPAWFSAHDLAELRGKNLACWCAPGAPCHADVLLDLANRPICEEVTS
jgi:hypothetical protein